MSVVGILLMNGLGLIV